MGLLKDKSGISKGFSVSAREYDKWAVAQGLIAKKLAEGLPGSASLTTTIDIGCGTGYLIDAIVSKCPGADILGIDIAPGMIEYCEDKYKDNKNIHFLVEDAENFHIPNKVDSIISSCAFQWFHNPAETLNKLTAFLKKNGIIALAVLIDGSLKEIHDSFASISSSSPPGLSFPTPESVLNTITTSGLNIIKSKTEALSISYDSAQDALRSFKKYGASFQFQKDYQALSVAKTKKLIEAYSKLFSDDEGKVSLTYNVLYIYAEKA